MVSDELFHAFIAGSAGYMAQTDSWVNITPGPVLNYGASKLITKNNSIFVFNSAYSSLLLSTDGVHQLELAQHSFRLHTARIQ